MLTNEQPKICSCGLVMARVNGACFCPRCDRVGFQPDSTDWIPKLFKEDAEKLEPDVSGTPEEFAAGCAALGKSMLRVIDDLKKTMEDDLKAEKVFVYCTSCHKRFEVSLPLAAELGDIIWCIECKDQKEETN